MRSMWVGPILALLLGSYLARFSADSVLAAAPLIALWLASPAIAWWLSRPLPERATRLNEPEKEFLEELSRTTWRFFETFVGAEDNWLPPDNYQDYPAAVIAHRTSPTNMGLALLSNLAAYDFGFISAGQLEVRTINAFATMERLDRFRGHFFNWYDTRTLEPLPPRYVSTVDSGNLVGHLLTLREGLLQMPDQNILSPTALRGLRITLRVLRKVLRTAEVSSDTSLGPASSNEEKAALRSLAQLEQELMHVAPTLEAEARALDKLVGSEQPVISELAKHPNEQVRWWAGALTRQAQSWLDEVRSFAPLATLRGRSTSLSRGSATPESSSVTQINAALERVEGATTLRHIARLSVELSATLDDALAQVQDDHDWLTQLKQRIDQVSDNAAARIGSYEKLARTCLELSDADFDFLFDEARRLLAIGFNVAEQRRDASFYDLLASEARLASYVAIAEGQLPQEHWFALGRLLTGTDGELALLSWSGSMFEYLMPLLVMSTFDDTLLDRTCHAAVAQQIAYGAVRKVPWGMSESGYNATDIQLNYQYRAFGVPGLGFKRGLSDDLVVAPYASAMALMVSPHAACTNLRRIAALGIEGKYGFYEAIDYTPARLTRGQPFAVVRSFMAHHQGMSFLSCAYALLDRPMQRRFEAYPPFQATELLLHERIPKAAPVFPRSADGNETSRPPTAPEVLMRVLKYAADDCSRSAPAVERTVPRHDHQRRQRLQPLEGHCRNALA